MRISQLRAFVATVDTGSFTAAARALDISQPSVSELVRGLEEECETRLFVRAGRSLVITAAGVEVLPWARRAVENVAGAEDVARSLHGLESGIAAFGVLRNAQFYFLSNLAEEFHRAHPRVRIRLVGQNSVSVAASVQRGELEAGLVVLPVPTDGLRVQPLMRDEVVWASSDPSRVMTPMTIERIREAPLILYDAHFGSSDPTRRQLVDRAQAAGVDLDPAIEVENVDTALSLVRRGLGETMVARAVAGSPMFPEGVHTAPLREPLYDVIALVTRKGGELSPIMQALVTTAVGLLGNAAGDVVDGR